MRIRTQEYRNNLSIAMKKVWNNPIRKKEIMEKKKYFYNDVWKNNVRLARLGKKHSEKTKKKMSLSHSGRYKNKTYEERYGLKIAEKMKEKISLTSKLRWQDEKFRKFQKEMWENKEFKERHSQLTSLAMQNPEVQKKLRSEEHTRNVLKGLMKRPTSFEQQIINLCKEHNLPFEYVGNGKVIINYANPDFINNNGEKQIIETYCKYWHPKNYEEIRNKRFAQLGFKSLFLNEDDLRVKNWEKICLNKIRVFMNEV